MTMTATVSSPTGMSPADARALTEKIKVAVDAMMEDVALAYASQAWRILGYSSWDSYCQTEFRGCRLRGAVAERRTNVVELSNRGLSTRAIGSALGINETTVRVDLTKQSGTEKNAPERVTGSDGKSYPRRPRKADDPERLAKIRKMAVEGQTGDQIAVALGHNPSYVRQLAREFNIDIVADRVVGKRRRPDSNRIVTEAVRQAESMTAGLDLIVFDDLDRAELSTWASTLRRSAKALNALATKLAVVSKEGAGDD
jgi:DNA-binding CsgD family transcriptional regulator